MPELAGIQFPPRRKPDGSLNREHFAAKLAHINKLQLESLDGDRKALQGYEALKRGILSEAEMLGLNEKDVLDDRSDHDRVIDSIDRLLSTQGQSVFEEADATLEAMERSIRAAVELTDDVLNDERNGLIVRAMNKRNGTRGPKRDDIESGKRWLSLLNRVLRLRKITRSKIPLIKDRLDGHNHRRWDDAYEASWPWRVAVYVYRSDLKDVQSETPRPVDTVFEIARHHCDMAINLWKNRNGITLYATARTHAEAVSDPTLFKYPEKEKGKWTLPCYTNRDGFTCRGTILICPPRHGKSTLGTAWVVCELVENPREQGIMLHAIEEKAAENFRHVKAAFDPNDPKGRRNIALFGLTLAKEEQRSGDRMRLAIRERTRDSQMRARGVKSGIGGANSGIQWWDDPVSPEEAQQPDVREATYRKLTEQYMRRQQGARPFILITATLWHHDDAVARILEQSRRNGPSRIPYGNRILRVGGPRTVPQFFSLWKSKYPPSYLRQCYNEINNPSSYAAQYMADPKPEETRIIRALRLYDPTTIEHKNFLARAEHHLSLDPSATSRADAKRQTDKASIVHAAAGELVTIVQTDEAMVTSTTPRIRVLDIREFHAGPMEAVDKIGEFALEHRVDKVHVEVVTFSSAIVEMTRHRYGLTASQVIAHGTGSKSKELRLRAVAPMLDDTASAEGLPGAVVEFPGVWEEENGKRRLIIEPKLAWAARQILDFGAVNGDHAVDALTQLLKHLQPEIKAGSGTVSDAVAIAEPETHENMQRRRLREAYSQSAAGESTDPWDMELVAMAETGL